MTVEHAHTTTSSKIRELQSGDRARWDELWAGYLEFYREKLPQEISDATWQRLIDPDDQPHGLVALDGDGRVIGFVHYHFHLSTWSLAGYCYLEDLFVDPAVRGRGAGRALIEAVYRAADQQGVRASTGRRRMATQVPGACMTSSQH